MTTQVAVGDPAREQTLDEKVPALVLDQDTVPVGAYPVTAAVHVVRDPSTTVWGAQLSVVVDCDWETVSEKSAALPRLFASPP